LWCVIIMCYKIKKLDDKTIDRSRCETIIEHLPKLIEKPKPDFDFWLEERLCIYEGRFIYFRKKEVDQDSDDFMKYLLFKGLEPFEVSEDFFNKLKEQWKKEGCGYYIVL